MQSALWSASKGDSKTFLSSITSEMLKRIRDEGIDEDKVAAAIMEETSGVNGYQILKTTAVANSQIIWTFFRRKNPPGGDGRERGAVEARRADYSQHQPYYSPASLNFYPTNFFATRLALCPPKPKELLMIAFTFIFRAVFGT